MSVTLNLHHRFEKGEDMGEEKMFDYERGDAMGASKVD